MNVRRDLVGLSLGSQSIELCLLNNEVTKPDNLSKILFDALQTEPSLYLKLITKLIGKPDLPKEYIHNALKWQIILFDITAGLSEKTPVIAASGSFVNGHTRDMLLTAPGTGNVG
tara:strand:+ start:674 stop:1018 length:345 start_codon:yes stop_codon:yes gene_type:complete